MTEAEFRKIALSLPETFESSHVGHADFRVRFAARTLRREVASKTSRSRAAGDSVLVKTERGKIFATLGYPDEGFGVLILTADQQSELIGRYPEIFEPVKGGWGKRGSTQVVLKTATREAIEPAMKLAWENASPRKK